MAFKIHGEVSLDGAMFKRGLHEIGGEATAFLKNFALGAVGIYSIEQAFDKTIESAEELVNTARKLDIGIEKLQVLRHGAEENGVAFDQMTKSLEKFNAVRENILSGGKGAGAQMAAMERLGINREALQNQTASQSMMGQISETARGSNAADIANDLKQVFGRGGQEIFGALKTDFGELENKMRSYGAIMDATTAVELKQFKEGTGLISQVLAAEFAPALVWMGKAIFEVIAALGTFGTMLGTWAGSIAELIMHPMDVMKNPKKAFKDLVSFGSGGEAGSAAMDYWNKQQEVLKAFEDKAKEEANRLANPKPQKVEFDETMPKTKADKEHDFKIQSDSLIASGNFLGAGKNAINSIAAQQLQVANAQLEKLNEIKVALDKAFDQDNGTIDVED